MDCLGTYGAACRYIAALYYDPENPTFRILVRHQDISKTLVTSLIHDLGQTAFGHDIEEVDEKLFSHTEFTKLLLEASAAPGEIPGESLKTIIEDPAPRGWGLADIGDVSTFLLAPKDPPLRPFDRLLREIVDGPVDADKLDYLIRDSVNCRVQYGHGIDIDRFIRSLTTICVVNEDSGESSMSLAIKAKGKASADAFSLARAQMYQAVYLHHTFRSVKAMFLTAAAFAIHSARESLNKKHGSPVNEGAFRTRLQNAYFRHVYLVPIGAAGLGTSKDLFSDTLTPPSELSQLRVIGGGSPDRTLDFFFQIGTAESKHLLQCLGQRTIFKRLFEISFARIRNRKKTLDVLQTPESRVAVTKELNSKFRAMLVAASNAGAVSQDTFNTSHVVEHLHRWTLDCLLIIDAPLRGLDSNVPSPHIVADYKRKYIHPLRADSDRTGETAADDAAGALLQEAAHLRVFADPAIHDLILMRLDQKDIKRTIAQVIGFNLK